MKYAGTDFQVSSTVVFSRQAVSADGCKATMEGLIDDGFGEAKDCPNNCKDDWNVLCRVSSNHSFSKVNLIILFHAVTL